MWLTWLRIHLLFIHQRYVAVHWWVISLFLPPYEIPDLNVLFTRKFGSRTTFTFCNIWSTSHQQQCFSLRPSPCAHQLEHNAQKFFIWNSRISNSDSWNPPGKLAGLCQTGSGWTALITGLFKRRKWIINRLFFFFFFESLTHYSGLNTVSNQEPASLVI